MQHQFIQIGKELVYSVYHEPNFNKRNNIGVVLCYPIGQEYIRCHKLYVYLANALSSQGYDVLRFDYRGTGDSSGEFNKLTIESCVSDLEAVVNEFRDVCECDKLVLIGARLGANISLLYSENNFVDKIVLLEPVVLGNHFVSELKKDYKEWLDGSFTYEKKYQKNGIASFGFLYGETLINQISNRLNNHLPENSNAKLLLFSEQGNSAIEGNPKITFCESINKRFWIKSEREQEKNVIPIQEAEKIIEWLKKEE